MNFSLVQVSSVILNLEHPKKWHFCFMFLMITNTTYLLTLLQCRIISLCNLFAVVIRCLDKVWQQHYVEVAEVWSETEKYCKNFQPHSLFHTPSPKNLEFPTTAFPSFGSVMQAYFSDPFIVCITIPSGQEINLSDMIFCGRNIKWEITSLPPPIACWKKGPLFVAVFQYLKVNNCVTDM